VKSPLTLWILFHNNWSTSSWVCTSLFHTMILVFKIISIFF
jgi:hypothetical protein